MVVITLQAADHALRDLIPKAGAEAPRTRTA
jgi:hypothetical protein